MKQHMPRKPCLLIGGENGISYDFGFYTHKANKTKHAFCTDITHEIYETMPPRMNYNLYCENYSATIRLNRWSDLMMKDKKSLKRVGRGSMDHRIAHDSSRIT